jgi:hypothetical protein
MDSDPTSILQRTEAIDALDKKEKNLLLLLIQKQLLKK